MPRGALTFVQRDFSAGQVAEAAARSDDVKLVRKGLKEALNIRLRSPRGFDPRFGRDVIYNDEGRTQTFRFGVDLEFRVTFGDGTVTVRDAATGDVVYTHGSYPWTLSTVHQITCVNLEREIIVCFPGSRPYVINYRSAVETQYSYSAGTVIGDLNFQGGRNAAFDGNLNKAFASCASYNSVFITTMYVGKTFTSPRRIGKVIVRGSTDTGYDAFTGPATITLSLYGKNGAAPTGPTDGTQLGTTSFSDNNLPNEKTINSNDLATEFDHLWVAISSGNSGMCIADVRFFTPSGAEAWASANFDFAINAISAKRQPYYKFAQPAVTMTPSALTGNGITITFSAPVLTSAHVGVSFRYGFRELVCATYVSPTEGTFNVIEDLPPTHNVTVASTLGFRIGDIAIGASSDCQALILDITSSTVMKCILLKRYAGFTSSEKVATETAVTTWSSTSATTHAASTIWDEAAMSAVRGWPRSVSQDRNRIIFADLPLISNAVAWSGIGIYNDFLPGADPTQAIFEYAPNEVRVKHVIGGPDEIVLTDRGVFYVPISETNPLAPGSVIFKKIGSLGAGGVAPVEMDQGIVFGGVSGNSIIAVLPTGQQSAPWELRDISRYHAGLISGLRALAVQSGGSNSSDQVLWAVNGDGTAVYGRLDPENQWLGFLPVSGTGLIEWISTFGSDVVLNVAYDNGPGYSRVVEQLNEDRYIDACIDINDPNPLLEGDPGDGPLHKFADLNVDLMLGRRYLGRRAVDSNGDLVELPGDDFSAEGIVAGFAFTSRVKQYLPNADEGEAKGQRMARRKVKKAVITVQDATEFKFMGRTCASFRANDPGDGDPPLWNDTFLARSRDGRSYDPETVWEKTVPGPATVIEMSGEVSV